MPVRRSRRDEARRLVAADDALAVDDGTACRGYSMALHRRRWQLHVHSSSAVIAACGALAVDGADVCRSCSCGSSSPLSRALCSRLVGGNCWRCQPAARYVVRIDSLCCKPCSRCRWRWRLKRLPVRLFVVAVVCFVFSTRRRRLLAMPVRRWIRDKNQQLVVAHGARAVDGAGVCESYSGGSSSSPLAALCTLRVGGDGWHCQPAARCVRGLGS